MRIGNIENVLFGTIAHLKGHSNFVEAVIDGMQKGIMTKEIFFKIFMNLVEEDDDLGDVFTDDITGIGLALLWNYCKDLADKRPEKKIKLEAPAEDPDPLQKKFESLIDTLEDDHK